MATIDEETTMAPIEAEEEQVTTGDEEQGVKLGRVTSVAVVPPLQEKREKTAAATASRCSFIQ